MTTDANNNADGDDVTLYEELKRKLPETQRRQELIEGLSTRLNNDIWQYEDGRKSRRRSSIPQQTTNLASATAPPLINSNRIIPVQARVRVPKQRTTSALNKDLHESKY